MREKDGDRERRREENWAIGAFLLVCSYVGHFFPPTPEQGICKSDIIRHLARSDASEDALSFSRLIFFTQRAVHYLVI